MHILTGGAGFIGSAFLSKLNEQGVDDILVVDNLSNSSKEKNIANKNFRDYIHKNDFLPLLEVNKLPNKIDAVIHLGACSSTTETDESYMMQNNLEYSKTLASYCLRKKINFLYASSAATYGNGEQGFSDEHETTPELKPLNIYARSKQLFDLWALETNAIKHITGIKFFNVFGPNEYHKGSMRSMVLKSYQQIADENVIKLFKSYREEFSDGEQKEIFHLHQRLLQRFYIL